MKSVLITLAKNLLLIILVVISVFSFWLGWFKWQDLLVIQILAGFVYVFLSCYEFLNASYKASLPVARYAYFPYSFFMFKTLKAFIFISFALMLLSSGTRVKYLYPVCLIIALTELIVMYLKYKRKLCFISIYANYLLISKNIMFKLFASDVLKMEFRHEIFYFVKKDGKAVDIRVVNVENGIEFAEKLKTWAEKNTIEINSESKIALDSFLKL